MFIHTRADPHQDKGPEFYRSFSIVIAGLDNIKARIWLNSTLFSLAEKGEDGEYDLTCVSALLCVSAHMSFDAVGRPFEHSFTHTSAV